MSALATETLAERIKAKFLNGCSPSELTDLAHALEEVSNPENAAEIVDDIRSKAVTQVVKAAMWHYEKNEYDLFVTAIDQATTIARVPVNGYGASHHNMNWLRDLKKTCDYDYKRLTSVPSVQRQHGYQARTQMGSP